MTSDETSRRRHRRDDGQTLHRRESRRQIILPYAGGIAFIVLAFLIVALPADPIWRVRAAAIADSLYIIFCLLPLWVCSFVAYVLVIAGIWGLNRLHSNTERPLRTLENLMAGTATRIEKVTAVINNTTIRWRAKLEQVLMIMRIFEPENNKEDVHDE